MRWPQSDYPNLVCWSPTPYYNTLFALPFQVFTVWLFPLLFLIAFKSCPPITQGPWLAFLLGIRHRWSFHLHGINGFDHFDFHAVFKVYRFDQTSFHQRKSCAAFFSICFAIGLLDRSSARYSHWAASFAEEIFRMLWMPPSNQLERQITRVSQVN